jgi:hypothetical protein
MIHRKGEEAPRVRARQVIIFRARAPWWKSAINGCVAGMPIGTSSRSAVRRRYANREGDSPITAFETGPGYVRLWFAGKARPYRYTSHVAELARLAREGRGLATFVSRHRDELCFTRD